MQTICWVFLKYDAKSRTGYGLRIERLPQQANDVHFLCVIMKMEKIIV